MARTTSGPGSIFRSPRLGLSAEAVPGLARQSPGARTCLWLFKAFGCHQACPLLVASSPLTSRHLGHFSPDDATDDQPRQNGQMRSRRPRTLGRGEPGDSSIAYTQRYEAFGYSDGFTQCAASSRVSLLAMLPRLDRHSCPHTSLGEDQSTSRRILHAVVAIGSLFGDGGGLY